MKLEENSRVCQRRDLRSENPLHYNFFNAYCLKYTIQPENIMPENLFYIYVKGIYTYALIILQINSSNSSNNACSNLPEVSSPLAYDHYYYYCVTNNVEPILECHWKILSDVIYVWILKYGITAPTIYDFYLNYINKTCTIIPRNAYDIYMDEIYRWSSKTSLTLNTKVCPLTYEYYLFHCAKNKVPATSMNDFLNSADLIANWIFTCQCDECQPTKRKNLLILHKWKKYASTLRTQNN